MVCYFRVYEPGGLPALSGSWLPFPFHPPDEAPPLAQLSVVPPVPIKQISKLELKWFEAKYAEIKKVVDCLVRSYTAIALL